MDFETDTDIAQASSSTSLNQQALSNTVSLRSSARLRTARERLQQESNQANSSTPNATDTLSRASKSDKGKRRASFPQTARPRRSNPAVQPLTLNEPVPDRKGKKRISQPSEDLSADEDESTHLPPPKRLRTSLSSYSLRSRNPPKGQRKSAMSNKSNAKNSDPSTSNDAGPSQEPAIADVEMRDENEVLLTGDVNEPSRPSDDSDASGTGDPKSAPAPDATTVKEETSTSAAVPSDDNAATSSSEPPPEVPPAEPTFASLMGADFQFGAYMASLGTRLKSILNNIKPSADPTTRLLALQDLSEILSMSTEDNLNGYFSQDSFVKELVHIMGGPRKNDDEENEDENTEDNSPDPEDEDAALAAALALSGGGVMGEENLEEQLLACRCLANLMEAMPGSAHTLVYHGAVPVLCSKLLQITFIDLAEQTISTLEKISEEYPSAIVREGGLSALLNYLDFFSTHVQRTALQAAANCCRNMSSDSFNMIRDVFPTIRNVLTYSDHRLVEYASMCVIRTIESFSRSHTEFLEQLITVDLIRSINGLLLPQSSGTTPVISPNTSTLFLRSLSGAAKSSPAIAINLLEAGIPNSLYAFLTGVLPPNTLFALEEEQGGGEGGQGVGSGLADMAVMQNLAHRPKDQVEEALSLICELMPPLPRDGVFDPRGYTEKAVGRAIKAKMKEARALSRSSPSAAPVEETDGTTVKTELAPHEAEMAAMLLAPESNLPTPVNEPNPDYIPPVEPEAVNPPESNDITTAEPTSTSQQDTEMGTAEATPASNEQNDSTAVDTGRLVNTDGEPLMAMMTDDADLPVPSIQITTGDASAATADATEPTPEIPAEVVAAIANGSSSRHRHGESSNSQARLQLLREHPAVVSQFLFLIVPILFDVYSASVTLQVRIRCFTGILKATSFLEGGEMELLYKKIPVASFIGSILTSRDNPILATNALQLVELLLIKSPSIFRNSLRKEGVLHEVSTISKMELKVKAKPPEPSEGQTNEDGTSPAPTSSSKKSSSLPSDPQDAYVLRSRLIKVKYLTNGGESGGDPMFESLKNTIKSLAVVDASEEQIKKTLQEVAKLFGNTDATISSFELLKSGLLDGLLEFTTATDRTVDIERRKDLFLEAFSARSGYATPSSQTPLAVLVKRLQESLTRMESFDVVTTSPGSDDAKRSSMSLISRTLRLKLQAEEPADVPKSCQNLMVSIHAIAPFSALDDYLKPRIAGILPFRGDMSQGLLQALTGNAIPPSVLTQSMLARLTGRPASVPNESSTSTTSGNDTLGGLLESLRGGTASQGATPSSSAPPSATSTLPIPIPIRRNTDDSSSVMPPPSLPETPTSEERTIQRRRSLRLRGQPPPSIEDSQSSNEPIASTSAPASTRTFAASGRSNLTSSLLRQLLVDSNTDEGAERTPGNDEEDGATERAFNLAFDSADGNLMASTPRGTRIATPMNSSTPNVEAPITLAARSGTKTPGTPQSKMSYAGAALSAIDKATDFYLEFRINDETIPMDMTIYGACHRLETRRATDEPPNPHAVWNSNYTITYRKIQGKRPSSDSNKDDTPMETDVVAGLAPENPSSKILRLLRVLHRLNTDGVEHVDSHLKVVTIPDSAFINNKLTAKLARQLEEVMILASNCLPDWALDLPQSFGFLFPFSTRYLFLQSTSFGYARLLNRVISQYPREVPNNNRREGLEQYGRLQRKKIEVPRDSPMQVALKVFDLFGASSSVLDIHFQGEVGTGLGPTLEFFASVSKEFAWKDLKLWRDADSTLPGKYVHHPFGLFPSPMLNEVFDGPTATERDRRKIRLYRLLGQFTARSLLDSRIIDVSLNKIFIKLILGERVPLNITSVKVIDPALGQSLSALQKFVDMKKAIESEETLNKAERAKRISKLEVNGVTLDDMCLDFTVPGYDDLELKASGKDIPVNASNVEEYIELVIDAILGRGARPAVQAFKEGFSTVFPITDLCAFSAEELIMMFGNADEDWSTETLNEAIKADHGFNIESKAIRDLIDIMTTYEKTGRRDFLQFITGSPKLPIGGFKALNPQLTVVRKPHEAPLTPDDYLPSVMTCAHYLKLPSYSSKNLMEKKLLIAMREGTGSFHLS